MKPILIVMLLLSLSVAARAGLDEVDPVDREATPPAVLEAIDQARAGVAASRDNPPELRAAAYGHLGDVLFAHGFSTQAEQAYRNARDLQPALADWHYLLGVLAIDRGQLGVAADHLSRAIERNPFDSVAHIRRGQVRLDQGQADRAEPDFERALALSPEAPAALAGMARVLLERNEYQAAADLLERALAVSPEATRLHQPLAMAYRGLGDIERAREQLAQAGSGDEPVADRLLSRVQAQSRSPQFYLEMALERAAIGDLDGARPLLAMALQLAPDDPGLLENYGEVVARLGDLDEAAAAFGRWTELAPESARAQFLLGQVEELRGRLEAAKVAYRRTLARDADHAGAAEALAFVQLASGEFAAAEQSFAALQSGSRRDQGSRYGYWAALSMLAAGDCQRGQRALEDLREGFPEDADVLTALARVRASCGGADDEALEQALNWTEAVYQAAPTTESSAALAMVYAALGRFEDAVDLQAQAMFEALKEGILEQREDLRADMARYEEGRPAETPFAPGYPGMPAP